MTTPDWARRIAERIVDEWTASENVPALELRGLVTAIAAALRAARAEGRSRS